MAKYCTKCGAKLEDGNVFCGICGEKVSVNNSDQHSEIHPNTASENSIHKSKITKNRILIIVLALISVLSLIGVGIALLTTQTSKSENSETNSSKTNNNANGSANDLDMLNAGYELLTNGGEFGDVNFAHYYIYDMDSDGKNEIIILAGTCEADAVLLVYAYKNGVYEQIGSTDGNHCSVCGNSKDGGIIVHHGIQGVESIDAILLKNGKLNKKELLASHEVSGNYTEFDYCITLDSFALNDYHPFDGANKDSTNNEKSDEGIDVSLSIIGSSVDKFLEDYKYKGGNYVSDWKNSFFNDGKEIYDLELDGTETNYYFYDKYFTVTARNGKIVACSQSGIQVSEIENVYQLLSWLKGDYSKLLEFEPEIINVDNTMKYLRWETKNAIMVINTFWWDGLDDWKNSKPWDYCVFEK